MQRLVVASIATCFGAACVGQIFASGGDAGSAPGGSCQPSTCISRIDGGGSLPGTKAGPDAGTSASPDAGGGCVAGSPATLGIAISGNHFVDTNGNTVQLHGVNRSGAEFACVDNTGIWDGPTDDDASISYIQSWNVNAIRLPMNEDCWLGINGVNPAYSGANYQAAIQSYVQRLNAHGLYVILNLHFSAAGTTVPNNQSPMADRDHSNDFWSGVATAFKDNHAVLFELFNEPYPDSNQDTTAAWTCVLNGGTCPGVSYTAAGMQEMLDAVRATGATQPVLVGGPQYSGVVDQWVQYKPNDPVNQLGATIHIYGLPLDSPCRLQSCWDSTMAPLANTTPIVISELGDTDCTTNFSPALLTWADQHGVSYTPWTWNDWNCGSGPSLITDYTGTPSGYGVGVKNHLLSLPPWSAAMQCGTSGPDAGTACTPSCSGVACGANDGCGGTCQSGSGCSTSDAGGGCTPSCSGVTCGSSDGCGGTCQAGSGCTTSTGTAANKFDHVVIILMENHGLTDIYGPAPYMTSLADSYTLMQQYSAVSHPSQPNYVALGGADTLGVSSDGNCCFFASAPNFVDRLEAAGLTWKAFAEDASNSGQCSFMPPRAGDHFPFIDFANMNVASRCANMLSTSSSTDAEFLAELNSANAANLVWLTPTDNNNMHDNSVSSGDAYLANLVPQILSSTTFTTKKAALFIVFDEGNADYPSDWVYAVWAGPVVKTGLKSSTLYSHYSWAATLEANWGFSSLTSNDASAAAMMEAFK